MNFKKNILRVFFIVIILQNQNNFSSMFPNAYQYYISKTELKTRNANQYNMPFVDLQFFSPLQDQQDQGVVASVIWQGAYSFDQKNNNFGCAFTINRKDVMYVIGDEVSQKVPSRDIRAEYIGGDGSTDVDMSLFAKQHLNSARIFVQVPLEKFTGNCFLHNWFLSLRTSITQVMQQLSMNLKGTPELSILNIYDFFKNVTQYAKIDGCQRTNIDFDNITLTVDGIYFNKNKTLQLYYYSGVEIPTNHTYSSEHLFYPFVGNNGNFGLLLGVDMRTFFHAGEVYEIGFLCEFEDHYLLYKTMDRVYDLFQQNDKYFSQNAVNSINKPWSRYLPAYNFDYPEMKETLVSTTSNLPTRVHECNCCDLSLGFIYHYTKILSELDYYFSLGYNVWFSQPEYVELQDRVFQAEYHEFYNQGIAGSASNTTSSQSTIKTQAQNDLELTNFTINDLDYGSAVSDGSYSQGLFFRMTALQKDSWNALLGGWFELGKFKMAPSRYGAWFGIGYEF